MKTPNEKKSKIKKNVMRVFFKFSKREKILNHIPRDKNKIKNPPFLCFDRVPLEFVELSGLRDSVVSCKG